jgi:hypothetical protein
MKKKIAKFFIIISAIAGVWGILMLAEYTFTYKERYSDITQSDTDKKKALSRAEKAVCEAAEDILSDPGNISGDDQAQFEDLTFVDGIYEQWIFMGEPKKEATLHMHFKKQDGSDLYMAVKHYPLKGNKWVKEMYGKDFYGIISGSVRDNKPNETAYDVTAGKRSDDFEEFAEGAFLSDCRRQYGQTSYGYYYILVKADSTPAPL